MPLTALATTVIGVLTPLVSKGVTQLANAAGDFAAKKAEEMLGRLRDHLNKKNDVVAADTLQRFEKEPEKYKPMMETVLQERLEQYPDLRKEIAALVNEMGDSVNVVQKLGEVEGEAIGAEVKGKGRVNVDQSADKVKGKIVGARVERL
jgi:phage-related tail protein